MFVYTHYVLPLVFSAIISTSLAIYGWRQRSHRVALYFSLMMVAVAIWVVMAIFEMMAVSLEHRLFWANLDFIGIAYVTPFLLLMVVEYIGKTQQFKRVLQASFIIPTLTNIIIWTNDFHSLWRGTSSLDTATAPFVITIYDYGIWFYVAHAPHGWIIIVAVVALLLRHVFFASPAYRNQIIPLLFAIFLSVIVDVSYIFGISPIPNYNFTPIMFSVSSILIAWTLYRYKFLDLMPIARDLVLQNMEDMVLVIDQQLRVVDANSSVESIVQQSATELIGLPISMVFPQQQNLIDRYIDLNEGEAEIPVTVDSREQIFNLRVSPIKQADKQVGRLIVLRDITSQKILAERDKQLALEQQRNQLQYQLITHASHDLMTPLSIIKTSLYIAEKTDDAEKRQEKLNHVDQQVERLQCMLEDMLFLTKIDMLSNVSYEEISLQDLIQNLIMPYQQAVQVKGQTLTVESCDSTIMLNVHPEYFSIAIARLLDNAMQYTPEGGDIQVSITCGGQQLHIAIQDNGRGIPEDQVSQIFERFYRVEAHRPTYGDFGLGLTIAKRIIELHHGTITVESVVNEGSIFHIELPSIL
jgi:PAS domain S-box-containing protein